MTSIEGTAVRTGWRGWAGPGGRGCSAPVGLMMGLMMRLTMVVGCGIALMLSMTAGASAQGRSDDKSPGSMTVFLLQGPAQEEHAGLSARLSSTVAEQARARGHKVEEVSSLFADTTLLLGCDSAAPGCQQKVLRQLDTRRAIFGTVEPGPRPRTVVVTLNVVTRGADTETHRFTIQAETKEQASSELAASMPVVFGDPAQGAIPDLAPTEGSDTADGPAFRLDQRSWILVGSGSAAVTIGVLFWFAADSAQASIDEAPTNTVDDLERLENQESTARLRANIGNVLVAAGVITASYGLVRGWLQYRRGSVEVAPVSPQGTPGVTLTWSY